MTSEEYKEISIQEFNKVATRYETNDAGIYRMCRKDYIALLNEIENETFGNLLDVGCGTGRMIALLNQGHPNKRLVGIDLSPKMIEVAKSKKLRDVEFIVGDAESLPFNDNEFDLIINSQSFHHYPNPQKFFNEVSRVLKPRGRLILRDNTSIGVMVWLINHIEVPLANLMGYGDVQIHTLREIKEYCRVSNLKIEKLKHQIPHRLHLVARKPLN